MTAGTKRSTADKTTVSRRFMRRSCLVVAWGCLAVLLVGCHAGPKYPLRLAAATASPAGSVPNDEPPPPAVERWLAPEPSTSGVAWVTPACRERVAALLPQMTLAEKIGQMTQPDRGQVMKLGEVSDFALGSVLSGGGSGPPKNEPAAWLTLVEGFLAQAKTSRLMLPLLYGIDAVHGHNNVRGATIFPHNIGLGCTRDPALVERVAQATARETRATGIDWTFAPVLAAARDERWGRTYEAFGETEELATLLGPAAIRGLQGPRLGSTDYGILACAKHFVGDGGTHRGIDRGNTIVTAEALLAQHLKQYQAAVAAGVGSIMVSFSSVNGKKMHASRELLTDLLKVQMQFQGFLISDWGAVELLPGDYATQIESAINAGVDVVMGANNFRSFHSTLGSLVPNRVPQSRIDDAVQRILTVKCELGLFDASRSRPGLGTVGTRAHREVAREAVQKSLVLLKNRDELLPLSKTLRQLHIAGKNADDLGHQCGGWTIDWQGQGGAITQGVTIRRAIEMTVNPATKITYSADASGATGAEAVVVVIGEGPYAEGNGDRKSLDLDAEDLATVRLAKASGAKVVLVIVSGRPLILGKTVELADAIVAAWLPGTEGQGVADVLFGDAAPTGKLGHSWPQAMQQIPINVGDPNYEPLFPYGYGLTYQRVSTSAGVAAPVLMR